MKPDSYTPTPSTKPDDHCYLCSRDLCEAGHLTSVDHLKLVDLANKYLDLCQHLSLNPVSCCENDLTLFVRTMMTGTNGVDETMLLEVLEKLHDPIDGKRIDEISSLVELIGIVEPSFKGLSERKETDQTGSLEKDTSVSVYEGFSKEESDKVSHCPVCQIHYPHATFVVNIF